VEAVRTASAVRRKDEEMRGKAIKVLDFLQYSAKLGNLDVLFTPGKYLWCGMSYLL